MFHMRELVRIGGPRRSSPGATWVERGLEILRAWARRRGGRRRRPVLRPAGRMLAASQREQQLKVELLVMIAGPEPTAIASFNYHQAYFATLNGIPRGTDGGPHGVSRVRPRADRLALLLTHGLDLAAGRPASGPRSGSTGERARGLAAGVARFEVDPATYRRHWLHGPDRTYPETNCYADLVIELIHARGDEPLAILGVTARLDFETDQWTFFKPDPADLEDILGITIHETQPYRPLPDQIPTRWPTDATSRSRSTAGTCPIRRPRATTAST